MYILWSGNIWQYLAISGNIWQYLAINMQQNALQTEKYSSFDQMPCPECDFSALDKKRLKAFFAKLGKKE